MPLSAQLQDALEEYIVGYGETHKIKPVGDRRRTEDLDAVFEGYNDECITVFNWLITLGYPRSSDIGRRKDGLWQISVREPKAVAGESRFVIFAEGKSWKKAYQAAMERIRAEAKEKGIKRAVPYLGRMSEAQGDSGVLSNVKKKPASHMWFIAKTDKNAWVVSIGDPTKQSSKIKRTFHSKDDLRYWVKHEMADQVSPNHVIDNSGLKLVSPFYTQWYVDQMREMREESAVAGALKGLFGSKPSFTRASLIRHRTFGLFPVEVESGRQVQPLVTGSLPDLNTAAKKRGWEWKPDKSLFDGYWIDKKTRAAFEFDLV